jgi:hypothetical protein
MLYRAGLQRDVSDGNICCLRWMEIWMMMKVQERKDTGRSGKRSLYTLLYSRRFFCSPIVLLILLCGESQPLELFLPDMKR